jgi:hypothetical protein
MKKFLTTTAIASALALPATAAHESTDVTQTVGALQAALNSIVINFDGTTISQAATNAANLINYTAMICMTSSSRPIPAAVAVVLASSLSTAWFRPAATRAAYSRAPLSTSRKPRPTSPTASKP